MATRHRAFSKTFSPIPEDDTPRLIFADWLDDEGRGARAEFIRVQVERARLPQWDARQVRLRLREGELLKQHGRKWKRELPTIKGITWGEFRRGFVAGAAFATFAVLRKNAKACWAVTPLEAASARWPRQTEPVASMASIAGLRELSIDAGFFHPLAMDHLADSPLLSTLRVLEIRDANLGVDDFGRLTASPHLGKLTALRLPENYIGNGGLRALCNAASLTSLAELDLSQPEGYGRYNEDPILQAAGLEALAAWPGLARLRSLKLSGNEAGRAGLRALLRSPHLTGLKELDLSENGLDGQSIQEFGAARPELQLDVLNLGRNLLKNLGAADLALAPCLRDLKALTIDRCELRLTGARRLARAAFLNSLRQLNVNHNSFGPEGLHALLEKKPQELHTLHISNNDLGDEGAAHLAEAPASDTLQAVDLAHNGLGPHAAQALGGSKHLRNLLVLWLNANRIGKQAMTALKRSSLGKRLAVLEVRYQGGATLF